MPKEKKKKYVNAYLSSTYDETDFGDDEDKYPKVSFYLQYDSTILLIYEYLLNKVDSRQHQYDIVITRVPSKINCRHTDAQTSIR